MKEIIINPENILDEEITDRKVIHNYVFMSNNKVLLKYHHNSYYFIHDEDISKNYNVKPFLVKKIYEKDYPFFNDKCLTEKYFYIIKEETNIENSVWLDIEKTANFLEENRYNNPRVQNITDEIIEIMKYLLTIC